MKLNIKQIRLQAMLTQEEFAKEFGVQVCAVRNWESGKYNPALKNQRKIVEFCKQNNINY